MTDATRRYDGVSLRGPLALIMGGLLVWGAFHAFGAYLSLAQKPGWSMRTADVPSEVVDEGMLPTRPQPDARKAAVVGVCTLAFLGFWLVAILLGNRRRRRMAERLGALEAEAAQGPVSSAPPPVEAVPPSVRAKDPVSANPPLAAKQPAEAKGAGTA